MPGKHVLVGMIWAATALILIATLLRVNGRSGTSDWVPRVGETIKLDSISEVFGTRIEPAAENWFLVVTSDCDACLALDGELVEIRDAARSLGVPLVPLIVQFHVTTDSIVAVLARHVPRPPGISTEEGFSTLRLRAVPSLLSVNREGQVLFVANPMIPESWPVPKNYRTLSLAQTARPPGSTY